MKSGPAAGGAACYVYYRVNAGQLEAACDALAELLAEIRARTGIDGTLSRRVDPQGTSARSAEVTLMEVYAGIADPAAFEAELLGAVERGNLQRFLAAGARRSVEWFAPLFDSGTPSGRPPR